MHLGGVLCDSWKHIPGTLLPNGCQQRCRAKLPPINRSRSPIVRLLATPQVASDAHYLVFLCAQSSVLPLIQLLEGTVVAWFLEKTWNRYVLLWVKYPDVKWISVSIPLYFVFYFLCASRTRTYLCSVVCVCVYLCVCVVSISLQRSNRQKRLIAHSKACRL